MVYVRVRLRFDSSPLHYAKKCWFVFDAEQCSLVKDVAYLIARQFGLTQGIQLYMDDFLIPVNESAQVIRDNDLIRVVAVECKSSNTTVVLSEEEQSPKVKRRKAEKSEGQTKVETKGSTVHAASSKTAIARTANQQIKPLTKVGESSNKSKSSGGIGKLKAVTRKSSSGALHITFQSSSSSESTSESESESSSSSSDSSEPGTAVGKTQRDNAVTSKISIVQTPLPSVKATATSGNHLSATGAKSGNGQAGVSVSRRGRRNRKKSLPTNITVGGDRDVLTTKSTLYKSPVLNKKAPGTNPKAGNKESENSTSSIAPMKTNVGGREAEKQATQWDVQPAAPAIEPSQPTEAKSASISAQPPATEQPPIDVLHPPRDYSTLPELQGPPRQGDKLAFKMLEMSSSYTPVISEYKEATVLEFDPSSKLIQVEYTEETLMKLKCSKETGKHGKFELQIMDEGEDDGEPQSLDKCVEIALDTLIEPKLIT